MKGRIVNLRKLFPLVAVLVCASVANPQADRRLPDLTIQAGTVTEKSPVVDLKTAGKEVAPGVFEVDPASIRGKRLGLPRGGQALRAICIGQWRKGECKGIYIEW
ncbi:MAG: hypothetical protein AABO57_26505 [Acidobacteriota bacterium]